MPLITANSMRFETWRPPPQEGFADGPPPERPLWTRLFLNDVEVSNSLEAAVWDEQPSWPFACELCWTAQCSYYGLANIVRINEQVLWLESREEHFDSFWRDHFDQFFLIENPILVPKTMWEELTEDFPQFPIFEKLPLPTGEDLKWLWLQSIPDFIFQARLERPKRFEDYLDYFRTYCIAADPLTLDESLELFNTTLKRIESTQVSCSLLELDQSETETLRLYFDFPGFPEWAAIALSEKSPILNNAWILNCAAPLS